MPNASSRKRTSLHAEDREARFKESERTDPDVIEAGVERLGDLVGRLPDE